MTISSLIRIRPVGVSANNIPILAWFIGDKSGEIIHFYGGVHGDEPEGVDLALQLKDYLMKSQSQFPNHFLIVVPVINPDGYEAKNRVNGHGVDLNRNFKTKDWVSTSKESRYYPGPHSDSEPETQALVKLIKEYPPKKIISFHSLIPHQINYDGPAKALAEAMSQKNNYPVTENIGYPTPGSLGSYAGIERNIPVITYELPEKITPREAWKESFEAILVAISYKLE